VSLIFELKSDRRCPDKDFRLQFGMVVGADNADMIH
jgi:hypothetical protein